jgi:hypothetical protein
MAAIAFDWSRFGDVKMTLRAVKMGRDHERLVRTGIER